MPAPRKYPLELIKCGMRMVFKVREETGESRGVVVRVAKQLGVHPEALRHYVRQAEIDGGWQTGTTSSDVTRLKELEREVRELRRANEIHASTVRSA
jgi:transposase